MSFRSERVEHSGQLDSNVPGTDHKYLLGLVFNVEESIRVDTVLCARNLVVRRHCWSAADCNGEFFGFDFILLAMEGRNFDSVSIQERSKAFVVVYLVVDEVFLTALSAPVPVPGYSYGPTLASATADLLDPVQTFNVGVTFMLECRPIERP